MVSEVNTLKKKCKTIRFTFIIITIEAVRKCIFFFYKYAMKNNLLIKMQITYLLMASKNIDFDHVCHVIMYSSFSHSCT